MAAGTPTDHGRMLDALDHEVELLVRSADAVPPETVVPTCPGWTVGEVVRHVGSVARAASGWLREGQAPRDWRRAPAAGQTPQAYLRDGVSALRDLLAAHGPAEPAATWWDTDRTFGFWRRRMLHEVTVHRVDVERAAGPEPSPIADEVAVDGVDEAVNLWFGHRLGRMGVTGTRPAAVAVDTAGRRWLTHAGPDGAVVVRGPGDGAPAGPDDRVDAVVSGAVTRVYLWLWGREGPGSVTVDGDDDAVAQLWALLRLATR